MTAPTPTSVTDPLHSALAPLDRAGVWLNSEPLTADALRGRVVLVDFWTYSCVNWLRTLPHLDVDESGEGAVSEPRMYQLIRQRGPIRQRTFEIRFLDPGVRAYVFTFG